jgi:uncharacterized protein YbjT (DUF2867 family)
LGADKEKAEGFGRWHQEADQAVRDSGLENTILRPNGFQQNYLSYYAPAIRRNNSFAVPTGEAKISFIDARDIAEVAFVALTTTQLLNRTYDLTGPEALSNSEIATRLSQTLGRPITFVSESESETEAKMKSFGSPGWRIQAMLALYRFYREGNGSLVSSDVPTVIGRPAKSISEFFEEYKQSF